MTRNYQELKLHISEQFQQFLDRETSGVEYRTKSANTEILMIRDYDASRWFFASENDVAATLALHNETDFLQGATIARPERSVGILVM